MPLVIRTPAGGRRGYGPTHSQNPETLLCAVPGLTVVFPSARHVPGDLLWNSVFRWPYPTVFLEHKLLYGASGRFRGLSRVASRHRKTRQRHYFRRWWVETPILT